MLYKSHGCHVGEELRVPGKVEIEGDDPAAAIDAKLKWRVVNVIQLLFAAYCELNDLKMPANRWIGLECTMKCTMNVHYRKGA